MIDMTMASTNKALGGEHFLEGKLLIALPGMTDPRFEKAVIFICSHSSEGAMGVIVNKPIVGLGFQELAAKLNMPVTENTPDIPVLYGGPVGTGRGFVLHHEDTNKKTEHEDGKIELSTTMEIVCLMAEGNGPKQAIFVLGYAGWAPGQIENEIRLNGWVHCDADCSIIFDKNLDSKWGTALAKLGIELSGLTAHAGRA